MAGMVMVTKPCGGGTCGSEAQKESGQNQSLALLELLVAALRKSMVACRVDHGGGEEVISAVQSMDISWPTNVRHITHVTFDRFNGFLGLPVEFEVEVPCEVPSASVSVFGVSAESMQCSYDTKGNSVPTILLLMQERLYSNGGLKAEGIFRINPENTQENIVRDQLNRGVVPKDIDVHCLAGLIKAWFRELPCGILDGLSTEQVLECNTEEDSIELIKQLKPTESALLNWAVELMADVVEEEELNKMNARNVAMVFAPNMTQMSDPLTALMHAVQVMNLLKTLIMKTIREREEASDGYSASPSPSSYSSQASDGGLDSQHETDMDCECTRPSMESEYNYGTQFSDSRRDEGGEEAEFLAEIEECFLKHINEAEEIISGQVMPPEDTNRSHNIIAAPTSDSGMSLSANTRTTGSTSSVTSAEEEDSGDSFTAPALEKNMTPAPVVNSAIAT
uniref:Uncharacterized protein n=1 Tax=Kalanchoe fedtschenkoi TaxID=63787 RepID=A0A7N0ZW48_KALFE